MSQAQKICPDRLLNEFRDIVQSESPNIGRLHTRLESDLHLSSEDNRNVIYQVVARLNASLFPPLTRMELVLTEACNLACTYCFERGIATRRRMPKSISRAAIDLLFDYSGNESSLSVMYFGGEPLMAFPAIRHATEYAEHKAALLAKSIDFSMTSNGVLLTESKARYLAEHRIGVLLSIDGLEDTHDRFRVDKRGRGSFARVMKAVEILKKHQLWVGAKVTVMPMTAPNLFRDVSGLHGMGVNQFVIGPASGVEWSQRDIRCYSEERDKLFKWYKDSARQNLRITQFEQDDKYACFFGCRAGRHSISVSVDGQISPCSRILALNSQQLLAKLGDVRYGLTHLRNRSELVTCSQLRSSCQTRGIAGVYQGGCFAANYEDNQDLFEPSMQQHTFSMLETSS